MEKAQLELGVSLDAAKLALHRLAKQGHIASPARRFYVIVPPEYRLIGCLPAEQFIPALMGKLDIAYYAGLLSAAQYYGAAHHRPQEFQVFVEKNRRPIKCGSARVAFIAKKRISKTPTRIINTPRGGLRISTPEATAVDLVGYSNRAGGLDQVTTILSELSDQIDPLLLRKAAEGVPVSWAQRLGFLLEVTDGQTKTANLKNLVKEKARDHTSLIPGSMEAIGPRSEDWKLIINAEVEPDL